MKYEGLKADWLELFADVDASRSELQRQTEARVAVSNALLTLVADNRRNEADLAVATVNQAYWVARNTAEGGTVAATLDALAFANAEFDRLTLLVAGGGGPPPNPPPPDPNPVDAGQLHLVSSRHTANGVVYGLITSSWTDVADFVGIYEVGDLVNPLYKTPVYAGHFDQPFSLLELNHPYTVILTIGVTDISATISTPANLVVPTGTFTISGTTIRRDDNSIFVPLGVNLKGSWTSRPSSATTTAGLSDTCLTWGFNAIRLFTRYQAGGETDNNDLDGIIAEFTAKHIVVILCMSDQGNGGYPDYSTNGTWLTGWRQWANAYKNNPYVWFNTTNENGYDPVVSSTWDASSRAVCNAIRSTGATNVIVLDGQAYGQDRYFGGTDGHTRTSASALLTYGPGIVSSFTNVMFSFHVYDQWEANSSDNMADYISRIQAAGLCAVVGEAGDYGYVNTGNQDFTAAFDAAVTLCPPANIGVLAWHGQSQAPSIYGDEGFVLVNSGTRSINAIDATRPTPGNLAHMGTAMWALGRANV